MEHSDAADLYHGVDRLGLENFRIMMASLGNPLPGFIPSQTKEAFEKNS